jgi:5-hydroxyisourate hydrolase-like protein (transthyretin family)
MDVSPGTQTDKMKLLFPNGVPAVSDDSMSEWMLHVYKQFPQPKDVKGVEIEIWTNDANGNDRILGTVESDANGRFSFEFTPDTEGQYTIYAVFDGSASYYPKSAQNEMTAMKVEVKDTPRYELYIIVMGIAIIITVILVGLIFRKK